MEAFFYAEKLLVIEAEKNKTFYIRFNLTLRTKRKNKLKPLGFSIIFSYSKKHILCKLHSTKGDFMEKLG